MKDIIIIVLNTGEHIITQYDEDYEGSRFQLYNSYLITGNQRVQLTEFPRYSSSNTCIVYRDSILTVVENIQSKILQLYISRVGEKLQKKEETQVNQIVSPVIRDDSVDLDSYWEEDVDYIEEE